MQNHISYTFRFFLLVGLLGFTNLSRAQSCDANAKKDIQDCSDNYNAMQAANIKASNAAQAQVAAMQGDGDTSALGNQVASGAAQGWGEVINRCVKDLNQCKTQCQSGSPEDQQSFQNCKDQITQNIENAGTLQATNADQARGLASINNNSGLGTGDDANAQVQKVGCTAAMGCAVAMRVLGLVQGYNDTVTPAITNAINSPTSGYTQTFQPITIQGGPVPR